MDKKEKKRPMRVGTVFKTYATEVQKHPWLFSATIFGTLLLLATELAAPLFLRQFFNLLVTGNPDTATVHTLLIILGSIALLSLTGWAARRIHIFSLMYVESGVMAGLYTKAFRYLIGHSYHFFSSQFSGTLTRRVSKFANAFEALFDALILQFVPTTLFVGGAIVILYLRNATLGLALLAWVVLFLGVQIYFARKRQPIREARAEEDSRVVGYLADAISNQNAISLFSGTSFESNRFLQTVLSWRRATMRSWNSDEYTWAVLGLLMVFIQIGLLYGALHYWELGLLTVGDFALIQAYLIGTIDHLIGINRELRRFYDSIADASEMVEILETPHEIQDSPEARALAVSNGRIEFTNVDFHFYTDRPTFADLNMVIEGKEKVALVGPSGAGKSTVTRLLLRFYDVVGGKITIDGQDIREVTQESLRDQVAYVPQEPVLFHRTLMENIRYGRRDATDHEVIEAAKRAHCHEFISALPQQYETFVGERGIKLSGGERQRVAIARAILKNAPILILDEATSSLDSESESLIQDALAELMKGKTVVVIAHRLSTIMKMDRIIVMEGGKVVLSGSHSELLAQESNLYKKLWEIQAGGFISKDT